jgi:hypothetical protein
MTTTAEFIEWLAALAPEGETALIVRQTPRRGEGGEVLLHPDGAVKATWPAFLPTRRVKADEAWFGNTASFVIDRFIEGKPSASAANCEYVLAMMLDDIGTKSKEPPLAPTWIMETSPGNYQWGYAFGEQPTKAEYAAAIEAIAEAGYTDPGACNPVRNFRLPGSVNLKPNAGAFAARLVEFDRKREYSLAEICAALGVTPKPVSSSGPKPVRLADDGADDVAAWLSSRGLVLSRPNPQGWMGVVCPNAASHTDGNPEGRYLPSGRSFCCLHSHCVDLDSAWFLEWVAEQGGPKHTPGLRDELLQQAMLQTIGRLTPPPEMAAEAAQALAEVERREVGRVEKAGWWDRFAYLVADDAYFDLEERRQLSRGNFNAIFRHISCRSIHGKNPKIEASVCYDEHRQAKGGRVLQGVTYAAGESVLVSRSGDVYGNRWRDARPVAAPAPDADVGRWLAHAEALIPDAAERAHVLDVMAYKLQNPRVKVNHGILHGGTPGAGKDTLWAPFFWAVGKANVSLVRNEEITSQWGYAYESEVLVLNELRQTEARDRRALENTLKPILAAPPETIPIQRKGLHPYDALNRLLVVAFTNERAAISLPSDDRRWFVTWSGGEPMAKDAAAALWAWYAAGGYEAIAGWLLARDVSAFQPGAAPMMTEAKAIMLQAGLSGSEAWIVEQATYRLGPFARGVVGGPWQGLCDTLQALAPGHLKIVVPALFHGLREAGWIDMGRVYSVDHPTKRHAYRAPDWTGSKSDARRLLELPSPSSAEIIARVKG